MVLDIAEKDAAVGFGNRAEDIDGGPIPAGAKMHAVFRIAVDAFHFVIRPFTGKALSLLFCQMAMGTQCKDDGDIFRANSRSFQLLQDTGDQKPGRHGARNVARDDNDLFPRLHDLREARRGNRMSKCPADFLFFDICLFARMREEFFHRMAVIYMKGNVVFEVFDTEIHGLPPYT